jgi:hypothetical protein
MYGRSRTQRSLYLVLVLGLVVGLLGLGQLISKGLFRGAWASGEVEPARAAAPRPRPTTPPPTAAEAIALVQQYNQADVRASAANDLSPLLPYVHSDGPLYRRLADEFHRRIAQNEVHQVALTRFWVRPPQVTAAEIVVQTREIWDETVVDNQTGAVLRAEVGIATAQSYILRPDQGGVWRIWELSIQLTEEEASWANGAAGAPLRPADPHKK